MINKAVRIVPNGVNTSTFTIFNRDEQKKRTELNYNVELSPDLNIVYAGRFSQEKGLNYLIDSMRYLMPTARLFLAGDGPEKEELKKSVNKYGLNGRIIFLGEISHENLPELLNCMDVFVLPAVGMEGFSNSMLEAMACGLPVVTTTIGAGPEIIKDGIGKVVETKNPEQLADGIMKCMHLEHKVIRDYVKKNFSFDVVAARVYEMYSGLCGKDVENICFCSLYAPPFQLSGAGMQVHELSKELSRMCSVSVISSGINNSHDEIIDGVRYIRVKFIKGEAISRFCYSLLGSLRGLSLDRFDVVDGRNWEGGLISVFLARYKRSRSVVSFRGEGAVEGPWIKNYINRYIVERVDLMTATDANTALKVEALIKK